jgi:hypothetical protein
MVSSPNTFRNVSNVGLKNSDGLTASYSVLKADKCIYRTGEK